MNKFKIPYAIVYDIDHQTHKNHDAKQAAGKSTSLVEAAIDRALGCSVVFANDIEEEIGLAGGQKNKPYAALIHITSPDFVLSTGLEAKIRSIYA